MFCRAVGFFDQRDARMMAKYAFFIAKPTMVFVKIGAGGSALGELATISVARLIIHPVLVAALFLLIPGVDPLWIKAALLSACLPVAANVFVLSDHYGGYSRRSASAILMTTILASITVPVVLYIIMQVS